MTRGRSFHSKPHKDQTIVRGHRKNGVDGNELYPRIVATLDPDDFRRLVWLAKQRRVPVASIIRAAVHAYLLPIRADADRAAGLDVRHLPPSL